MDDALHELGRHKRENEIYLMGLELAPENNILISKQMRCAFSRDADNEAELYMDNYRAKCLGNGMTESRILGGIGVACHYAKRYEEAKEILDKAWAVRGIYNPAIFKLIRDVEQALASE
jgi:tetratricopeptide (TPR) repeat protein